VLVALGFAPVREWGARARQPLGLRRAAGARRVLTALGQPLAGALTPDELLPAIAHAAAVGVGRRPARRA
jgi:hypothetical protein